MANNAISSIEPNQYDSNQPTVTALIITIITLAALLLGWLLKNSIENRIQVQEHAGVRAEFPIGWKVETGLNGEQFVFSGSDPFDSTLTYAVNLLPVSKDMKVSDLVVTRNLERGQILSTYRVLDQEPVVVNGKNAYSVHFAYVLAGSNAQLPQVIEGMDYYFFTQPRSMVVTLEEETSLFKDAQTRFMTFLQKVSMSGGE
jgi:hypothetical protein